MTGLLRKDWYYMREYGRTYVPLLLILCLVPGGLGGAYALTLALALPRGTIANDEIRWDRMAASLPLRAETVVGGKYLLCVPLVLLGMAVTAISQQTQLAVSNFMRWRGMDVQEMFAVSWLDSIEYALIMGALSIIIAALTMPLYYRFTARKGAIWANIVTIVFLQLAGTLGFNRLYSAPAEGKLLAVASLAALAAASAFLSFRLSVLFYRKRQRGLYDR